MRFSLCYSTEAMTFEEFQESISQDQPPSSATPLLKALWHEKKGDWKRAHEIAQDIATADASWVHAYLHRREGDLGNAGYWYSRAGRPASSIPLDREWEEIARALLKR